MLLVKGTPKIGIKTGPVPVRKKDPKSTDGGSLESRARVSAVGGTVSRRNSPTTDGRPGPVSGGYPPGASADPPEVNILQAFTELVFRSPYELLVATILSGSMYRRAESMPSRRRSSFATLIPRRLSPGRGRP